MSGVDLLFVPLSIGRTLLSVSKLNEIMITGSEMLPSFNLIYHVWLIS